MRFTRELTVGLTLLATLAVIVFGIRFFQGLPLFSGSYALYTQLEQASGITPGSAVRLRGVTVGSVEDVTLDSRSGLVRLDFTLHDGVQVYPGAEASISGLSTFGSVTLTISPGDASLPPLAPGSEVPATPAVDLFGTLTSRVPSITARTDTLLFQAALATQAVQALVADPDSDLRLALAGLRQTTNALNALLRAQSATLGATLQNTEALTGDLRDFTATNRDSLTLAVTRANALLRHLDGSLARIDTTAQSFDALLAGVENGEGTLGMLLTDSTLYFRLDTTVSRVDSLLIDFQRHPGRYLKHLSLIDVF